MNRLSEQISIVVIARNRAQSMEQSLKRLTTLHEPVPVIIVDNYSEDDTVQVVREKYPEVDLLQLPENYGSAGRNIGVERARTPYIAFADDDSWWREDALWAAPMYFE